MFRLWKRWKVLPDAVAVREKGFGGLPVQIGYCNGSNVKLNALEYHRSSEIDIAVTDFDPAAWMSAGHQRRYL